jgi:hypothetical protein
METTKPTRKKTGPKPRGYKATSVQLMPEVLEWATQQPEGLSGLVRQLLEQEMAKRLMIIRAALDAQMEPQPVRRTKVAKAAQ